MAIFFLAAQAIDDRPSEDTPVNPYAVGLKPDRWEPEGTFEGPVLTHREAVERTGGLDWLVGSQSGAATPPATAA